VITIRRLSGYARDSIVRHCLALIAALKNRTLSPVAKPFIDCAPEVPKLLAKR
jgi:hypothetical protein